MTYLASYLVIQVSFTIGHYENHTLSVVYVLKYTITEPLTKATPMNPPTKMKRQTTNVKCQVSSNKRQTTNVKRQASNVALLAHRK